MKTSKKLLFFTFFVVLMIVLCGCPLLNYKIYIRNLSANTANIIFIYAPPHNTLVKGNITVSAQDSIVPINNKTSAALKNNLAASVANGKVTLAIPPKTTVFVSDVIDAFYILADKQLIVQRGNVADTLDMNYPYRNIKEVNRKRDSAYNYFYRTIIYYDIK